jgi:hypothetical protein
MKITFDCHCLFMLIKYHNVLNFAASGSKGLMSGKVVPSSISQEIKAIRIKSQLK